MKKGIIFDLDGTLWNALSTTLPVWNDTLKSLGIDKQLTYDEMKGYMGKTIEEIADLCLPMLSAEERLSTMHKCCGNEPEKIKLYGGKLYPKVIEVLAEFKNKYHLYIVSNCAQPYLDSFLDYYKLHRYFDDYEMAGRTGKPKGENIKLIIERNNLKKAIYVGDTQGDCNASALAGIPFVFAEYGFGNVDKYDYKIKGFDELLNIDI